METTGSMKSSRKCSQSISDVIDGKTEGITQLSAKKYETLYNIVEDEDDLGKVLEELEKSF